MSITITFEAALALHPEKLARIKDRLAKWQEHLARDPGNAMEWADAIFTHAAELDLDARIQQEVFRQNHEGREAIDFDLIMTKMRDLLISMARSSNSSTAASKNLMHAARLQVLAEAIDSPHMSDIPIIAAIQQAQHAAHAAQAQRIAEAGHYRMVKGAGDGRRYLRPDGRWTASIGSAAVWTYHDRPALQEKARWEMGAATA